MKKKSWSPHLRMQTHSTIGLIAQDWCTLLPQVDPDLMRATGEGLGLDQDNGSKSLEDSEAGVSGISSRAHRGKTILL